MKIKVKFDIIFHSRNKSVVCNLPDRLLWYGQTPYWSLRQKKSMILNLTLFTILIFCSWNFFGITLISKTLYWNIIYLDHWTFWYPLNFASEMNSTVLLSSPGPSIPDFLTPGLVTHKWEGYQSHSITPWGVRGVNPTLGSPTKESCIRR